MFPNPQDAFPLPPQPNLEQYKKRAKELAKACKSGDSDAVQRWAKEWLEALARAQGHEITAQVGHSIARRVRAVAQFLDRHLTADGRELKDGKLADAQFVIARSHGFLSWPKLVHHLEELARADSPASNYEAAADAIVNGDNETLARLLRQDPGLIRARSTREHNATLLHYTAANGVENFRQKTPKNIIEIARMLLEAGAEIDAEAEVYGGGSTTLGLAATSVHPYQAGVQNELIQVLLDHGAEIDHRTAAGNGQNLVLGCLANGRGEAALYLAERGAQLNLETAAGVGRLDRVREFVDEEGGLKDGASRQQLEAGFLWACGYGYVAVVEYLLEGGIDITVRGPQGQTGLHWAAMFGRLETVELLLRHHAPLEIENEYGGTVLDQTLWSAAHSRDPDEYLPVIETLVGAGAKIPTGIPSIGPRIDELLTHHGSPPDPKGSWYGEGPVDPES
jgi:hypothetical protein